VGTEDLNWQVISVEVEGFAYQSWDSRTRDKVKELLAWLYKTHGNLTVLAHTDCSTKVCPGMATFQAALPNYYGNTLGEIFAPLPDTSIPTATVTGLPMRFRNRTGSTAIIRDNKPRRAGATVNSRNYGNAPTSQSFKIWGEVEGEDMSKYGLPGGRRWFFGPKHIDSMRVIYMPYADLRSLELK
jgi:hypothetical protein